MNHELKALWIADLHVNPNIQGKGCLRDIKKKYCCLGRLHELSSRGWMELEPGNSYYISTDGSACTLTYEERLALEIGARHVFQLMMMNDGNMSFLEIADWIEENL